MQIRAKTDSQVGTIDVSSDDAQTGSVFPLGRQSKGDQSSLVSIGAAMKKMVSNNNE